MYFMSDPQALHVTRNVIPGKLGVDLHLHRVHIPLVTNAVMIHKFVNKTCLINAPNIPLRHSEGTACFSYLVFFHMRARRLELPQNLTQYASASCGWSPLVEQMYLIPLHWHYYKLCAVPSGFQL